MNLYDKHLHVPDMQTLYVPQPSKLVYPEKF